MLIQAEALSLDTALGERAGASALEVSVCILPTLIYDARAFLEGKITI